MTEEYRNLASQIAQNASYAQTSATNAQTSASNAQKILDDTKEFANQAKTELNQIKTDTSVLKDEANTSAVNAKSSETKAKEYADNLQASTDDISKLKEDLDNKLPKSPTNWGPWTSEEQAAALNSIGIDKPFEMIDTIKIDTDDVIKVIRDVTPDGTPYNFESIFVRITSFDTNMNALPRIVYAHRTDANKFDFDYTSITFPMNFNDTYIFCERRNGVWIIYSIISHTNGVSRAVYAQPDFYNFNKKTITGFIIISNSAFVNGTEIKIYGVRA